MAKHMKVYQADSSIVWNKLLKGLVYTIIAAVLAWLLNQFYAGAISIGSTAITGIVIAILQAINKALQNYTP